MTQLITRLWTYEDYLELPDDGNRYEIIEGELLVTPPPTAGHQDTLGELYVALHHFVRTHGLGKVYMAPFEVHLSDSTRPVQPDLLFIRTENAPTREAKYFIGAPDMVVEILSPGTRRYDLTVKYNAYQKAGIREYWIVDPKSETVSVYALVNDAYTLHGQFIGEDTITSAVLQGLEIVNRSLFDT